MKLNANDKATAWLMLGVWSMLLGWALFLFVVIT